MTESVTKNGKTLDLNTEQGRANQSAYNDIAKSAMATAEAQAAETSCVLRVLLLLRLSCRTRCRHSYTDLVTAAGSVGYYGDCC